MRALVWRWMGFGDVVIRAYHAYSYNNQVFIRGRVLREDFVRAKSRDRWFRNLINMIRRLLSYELPSAQLLLECGSEGQSIWLDREGFFHSQIALNDTIPPSLILTIPHSELDKYHTEDVIQEVPIVPLSKGAKYAVLSDIDDTIMRTGVTSLFKWRLIINTLFLNPLRRRTFADTVDLYQDMSANGQNVFFYISNSPWNMYDYLSDYLTSKGFPQGIIFLRDININEFKSFKIENQNKFIEIRALYESLESLNFVLVGDAGEYDAHIYRNIANLFPSRTTAICIRAVRSQRKNSKIRTLVNANQEDMPILFFDHTAEMKAHLRTIGMLE